MFNSKHSQPSQLGQSAQPASLASPVSQPGQLPGHCILDIDSLCDLPYSIFSIQWREAFGAGSEARPFPKAGGSGLLAARRLGR